MAFLRANAPVRSNLLVNNATGMKVNLNGIVKHKDCIRPLNNACVELWHCSADGVYDNESPEFLYREKPTAMKKESTGLLQLYQCLMVLAMGEPVLRIFI